MRFTAFLSHKCPRSKVIPKKVNLDVGCPPADLAESAPPPRRRSRTPHGRFSPSTARSMMAGRVFLVLTGA